MKNIFLITLMAISHLSFGHDFFYAFAEMEYKEECSCVEVSVRVSAHDLNTIAESMIEEYKGLEKSLNNSADERQIVDKLIMNGFEISQQAEVIEMNYEGFELFNDDECIFYFTSEAFKPEVINLRFDLFMNQFSEQQNKLILIRADKQTEPYMFFIFKRQSEIKL